MTRPGLVLWGIGAIFAAVALGAALTAGASDAPALDSAWNTLMTDVRGPFPFLIGFGTVLDHIGGGWIATFLIPIVILAVLLLARRWRAAIFVAAALLLSAAAVQLLKGLFGRMRPEEMLVVSDFGSFPSGHTANAATLATLAVLLFPRPWVLIAGIGWTLMMAFTRTLVSAHWLTDTLGGTLIGVGTTLVLGGFVLRWARSRGTAPDPVPSAAEHRR